MLPIKTGLTLLLLVLVFPHASIAAEKEKEIRIEVEAGTLLSNYFWRGLRLSEGPVYQSSVTILSRGFALNLWGNVDFDSGEFNETDLTLSYSRDLKKVGLETGLIHYAMIDGHDSDELYAKIAARYPVQPSLEAFFDVNAGKGVFLRASAGHHKALSARFSLDVKLSLGAVFGDSFMGTPDSGREFTGFHNAELLIACPIELGRGWSMKLRAGASTPLSRNARQAIVNGSVCEPGQRFCNGTIVYAGTTVLYAF